MSEDELKAAPVPDLEDGGGEAGDIDPGDAIGRASGNDSRGGSKVSYH